MAIKFVKIRNAYPSVSNLRFRREALQTIRCADIARKMVDKDFSLILIQLDVERIPGRIKYLQRSTTKPYALGGLPTWRKKRLLNLRLGEQFCVDCDDRNPETFTLIECQHVVCQHCFQGNEVSSIRRRKAGERDENLTSYHCPFIDPNTNKRCTTRANFSHYLIDYSLYFKDYETNASEGADDSDEEDETYVQLNGGRHFHEPDDEEDAREREFKLARHTRLRNLSLDSIDSNLLTLDSLDNNK